MKFKKKKKSSSSSCGTVVAHFVAVCGVCVLLLLVISISISICSSFYCWSTVYQSIEYRAVDSNSEVGCRGGWRGGWGVEVEVALVSNLGDNHCRYYSWSAVDRFSTKAKKLLNKRYTERWRWPQRPLKLTRLHNTTKEQQYSCTIASRISHLILSNRLL